MLCFWYEYLENSFYILVKVMNNICHARLSRLFAHIYSVFTAEVDRD